MAFLGKVECPYITGDQSHLYYSMKGETRLYGYIIQTANFLRGS